MIILIVQFLVKETEKRENMRRKDREVTDNSEITDIIRSCSCCRLGFYDKEADEVYIVPLSFGYEETATQRIFYFHGAKAGRKVELLKASPKVGFELDTDHELVRGASACNNSMKYKSIIGTGVAEIIENDDEKRHALLAIMQQQTGQSIWDIPYPILAAVCVFKLTVQKLSCKAHI